MNIIKKIINGVLSRDNKFKDITEVSSEMATIISPIEEISFESDTIVLMASENYLDATNPENIAKYKSNLKVLVEEAKKTSKITKFALIRNDDFFPYNWEWDVSSRDTGIEKSGSSLTYWLRHELARESDINKKENILFDISIPLSEEKMKELMANIDRDVGFILSPIRFRSTKHFTINIPLSYTGSYNNVESNRNFHIIDSVDNFLTSGYAYSAAYRDAYLDVTHESLPISESAVVMILEDKYEDIRNKPDIMAQLSKRRVIVFKGEEAVATNMILTEMGILPAGPGNRFMTYDDDVYRILENSMINICQSHNIEYDKGHGNMFGKGGHFTDLYDGYNQEYNQTQDELIEFLKAKAPEYSNILTSNLFRRTDEAYNIVREIGHNRLLKIINEYNKYMVDQFNSRYKWHKEDRATITPEISLIFKKTVKSIINYFSPNNANTISQEDRKQIEDLIKLFYHSNTVENQLLAATMLSQKLSYDIGTDIYSNNSVK